MYQLDWVTRCPDILSNFILSVSKEVFGDEINIYMVDLKQSRTLRFLPHTPCPLSAFCLWKTSVKNKFNQRNERYRNKGK